MRLAVALRPYSRNSSNDCRSSAPDAARRVMLMRNCPKSRNSDGVQSAAASPSASHQLGRKRRSVTRTGSGIKRNSGTGQNHHQELQCTGMQTQHVSAVGGSTKQRRQSCARVCARARALSPAMNFCDSSDSCANFTSSESRPMMMRNAPRVIDTTCVRREVCDFRGS